MATPATLTTKKTRIRFHASAYACHKSATQKFFNAQIKTALAQAKHGDTISVVVISKDLFEVPAEGYRIWPSPE